jgi:CheY-like chemotaxis protein/anti-sigma regulatory factor (Ser/Thr protein kinase)
LYKILSNLIENALKFTNTGFIEFGYVIQNQEEQPILELYVKDTGKGIDKKHQELIFERFVQTEIDTTKRKKGLGLGLSIAKENTELIGGKISVTSTKGKGTTFFVRIPYKPLVTNNEITEKVSEKLNILIVEDEEVNYFYLTTLLEIALKIDCTFIHAKNGLEAVEIFEKNPKIDIVLMDLKMPIMDGYTATKKIKELNPKIPILVQTAYSSKNEKAKAKAAGCDQFISKPITKDRLLEKLKILIPSL